MTNSCAHYIFECNFCDQPTRYSHNFILYICLDDDQLDVQGGSNKTGTDLCVNKPHCAAAVRP